MNVDQPWRLVNMPTKGLGMIAAHDLKAGITVQTDRPLFSATIIDNENGTNVSLSQITTELEALNADDKITFFALRDNSNNQPSPIGIYETNTIPFGEQNSESGIFPLISRFNHSCLSNAGYIWNLREKVMKVILNKDVQKGEEITVNYIDMKDRSLPKERRQQRIYEIFEFTCSCNLCDADDEIVRRSDERRAEMERTRPSIQKWYVDQPLMVDGQRMTLSIIVSDPVQELRILRRMLQLLEEEGCRGTNIINVQFLAYQLWVVCGDYARASACCKLILFEKLLSEGENGDTHDSWEHRRGHPDEHSLSGLSTLWATEIQDAKDPEEPGFDAWLWMRCWDSVSATISTIIHSSNN